MSLTVSRIAHMVDMSISLASLMDRTQRSRLAAMTKIPVVSHSPYTIFLFTCGQLQAYCKNSSIVHESVAYLESGSRTTHKSGRGMYRMIKSVLSVCVRLRQNGLRESNWGLELTRH